MKQIQIRTVSANEANQIKNETLKLVELRHQNMIKYYEAFSHEQVFCIITEYCDVT